MLYAKLLTERLSGKDLDPCHVHSSRCPWIRQRPSTHSIKLRQDQQLRHVSGRLSELLGHKYEILPPDLSRFELLPRHRPIAGDLHAIAIAIKPEITPWTKIYSPRNSKHHARSPHTWRSVSMSKVNISARSETIGSRAVVDYFYCLAFCPTPQQHSPIFR